MPQASIDPVVMAAATVMRLQTILLVNWRHGNRPVTVGSLQAGTKENVIPDEAVIKFNVRTFDEGVRKRVLAAFLSMPKRRLREHQGRRRLRRWTAIRST